MTEFELIQRYFQRAKQPPSEHIVLGIGDDAAILAPPPGQQIVLCMDTLVGGRHFHLDANPADIGWKALAVNLSDLAAMGATPLGFQLALTLPELDERWLEAFSGGLNACAEAFSCPLIGGDTTRGPLTLSVQATGAVPATAALTRSGAAVGDAVWVSGSLGTAAAAVELWPDCAKPWQTALYRPQPQLELGQSLRGIASSCIDISDGLLADLAHVLDASGVGAEINADAIPYDSEIDRVGLNGLELACNGGDDYQLVFTVPATRQDELRRALQSNAQQARQIGIIQHSSGLRLVDKQGDPVELSANGYRHF